MFKKRKKQDSETLKNKKIIKNQLNKAMRGNDQIAQNQTEALQEMERLSLLLQTEFRKKD